MENHLKHYGSIAGSIVAVLGLLWLLGEPHLKSYIDSEIDRYDLIQKEADSKKAKLRKLLGEKMGIDEDEVHIELGHQYKNEKALHSKVDSLLVIVKELRKEDKLLTGDINANYSDILKLENRASKIESRSTKIEKKIDKHGLFN